MMIIKISRLNSKNTIPVEPNQPTFIHELIVVTLASRLLNPIMIMMISLHQPPGMSFQVDLNRKKENPIFYNWYQWENVTSNQKSIGGAARGTRSLLRSGFRRS